MAADNRKAAQAGVPISLGGPRARNLLACLLLNADRVVGVEQLVDAVWGDDPPSGARIQVQNRVSTLRAQLRRAGLDATLDRQAPGYLLRPGPVPYDLALFDDELRRAHALMASGDLSRAADVLRTALGLWHGPPLAGVDTAPLRTAAHTLEERRLEAWETCLGWELELGRADAVARDLTGLSRDHPYRERFAVLLMRALAAAGRRAAALEVYRRTRVRLVADLGIEPGPDLAATLDELLAEAPGRDLAELVPAQLPADVRFVDRRRHLRALDNLVPEGASCVVIAGPAGVGKSALAVHWGHSAASRFPDGQLHVGLRGWAPSGRSLSPGEALRGFLEALRVPPEKVPTGLQAQASLYRSLLAGRRMLIVLDDARDAEQVRPLLPGTSGSLVLVTSREPLTGLAVTGRADHLTLDLMDAADSHELLAVRVGRPRLEAEPAATAEIVRRCSGLPLALAVAAARAAISPAPAALTDLAAQLARAGRPLDAFTGTADRASDLRTVLSVSYRRLSPAAARVFRLLHVRIGDRIGTAAVAALADIDRDTAAGLLAELATAGFVTTDGDHHWGHDLLRAYATELTTDADEPAAALRRLLDYYLRRAYAADQALFPDRDPIGLVPGERFDSVAAAMAWADAERAVLVEAVDRAHAAGEHERSWQLAWAVTTYLNRSGHWHDWARVQRRGLAAANRLRDVRGQACCHRDLANAATRLRRYDTARRHLRTSLVLFERLGDRSAQVSCHKNVAWMEEREGRYAEALRHSELALEISRQLPGTRRLASSLNAVGWYRALLGDHAAASEFCREGLRLFRQTGDRYGEAHTLESLGYAEQHRENHAAAIELYERGSALCDEIGERYLKGQLLTRLGETHLSAADPDAARTAWRAALDIFDEIDPRAAADLRERQSSPR
ncbi:tetratricopeptide repeat protein [Actinoplanes sp. TRM 88003]|uniref:Tetratricopeptide repeat protein n=1 Tax=Paractinoplanes aksuensis TaxID=2939490 RepID=A0ABT1DKB0_9ACTN|nr:BTAD domain-containing putative transcriptional regulator [Actinoplanes aksuensis]MCO8270460.1 tetratricopeptide repeat protein [Actinoplanes aksuensis]